MNEWWVMKTLVSSDKKFNRESLVCKYFPNICVLHLSCSKYQKYYALSGQMQLILAGLPETLFAVI